MDNLNGQNFVTPTASVRPKRWMWIAAIMSLPGLAGLTLFVGSLLGIGDFINTAMGGATLAAVSFSGILFYILFSIIFPWFILYFMNIVKINLRNNGWSVFLSSLVVAVIPAAIFGINMFTGLLPNNYVFDFIAPIFFIAIAFFL